MKAVPAGLQAHLSGRVTTLARCWRLTLTDGTVRGFTDHDRDIAFDGVVHRTAAGLFQTADVARADFSTGGSEISGALSAASLTDEDLAAGLYDGAAVDLYLVNWARPDERMLVRRGTLGEVTKSDGAFRAEVRGPMHALSAYAGRVFSATCDAEVGDHRCKVDLQDPAFRAEGTVSLADGERRFRADAIGGFAPGFFSGGRVTFTGGGNAGRGYPVKLHTRGSAGAFLELRDTPREPLFPGDAFVVTAGCDKRFETCRNKFANAANFRGFPHIPGNDVALAYASGAGDEDGGSVL